MDQKSAIKKINQKGALLVFSIKNAKEPASLWSEFYPRSKMKWEWNEDSDDRVAQLWFLMKKLSVSRRVIYSKWYQNRATFFSVPLFTAMLCLKRQTLPLQQGLSRQAQEILDILESDSPLSTKQLKKFCDLQGRDNEPIFQRAMKELFSRLLIVAYGEVDDGAFPSLAVGSTKLLFEDVWNNSITLSESEAQKILDQYMPQGTLMRKYFAKTHRTV